MYKDLDQIIADYVGYSEDGCDYDEPTEQTFPNYDCADVDLYNNIVDECAMHLDGQVPLGNMSVDAQTCIKSWEELIESYSSFEQQLKVGV